MPRPKLDAEQFSLCIPSQMFVLLLELAQELGVPAERLCAGLACSVEDLRRGEEISHRQAWRMIRRALQMTGRADLGLELGIRQNLAHFGLTGLAMSVARTLGEAVEIGFRYPRETGGISSPRLEYGDDHVAVIVDSKVQDDSILPFVIEEFFASGLSAARLLVGDRFRPDTLEVTYPEPAYAARYQQIFGCPVRFDSARNCARIERRILSLPLTTHSAALLEQRVQLLESQAQRRMLPPRPTAAVERLLLRSGNGGLSIDQVAGALQLSVRTLRRRLREDGCSFRALCERIRVETAQRLLREQNMTVSAVAKQLGFSDARSFRRAFKRWLGEAPGKMREATSQHRAPRPAE